MISSNDLINLKIYKCQPASTQQIVKWNCLLFIICNLAPLKEAGCRDKLGTREQLQNKNVTWKTTLTPSFLHTLAENDYIYFMSSPNLCFSSCSCLNTSSSSGNADKSSISRRSKASSFKQTDDCKKEIKKSLNKHCQLRPNGNLFNPVTTTWDC